MIAIPARRTNVRRDFSLSPPAPHHAPRHSPRQDLAASTGDAVGYSLMVGMGETYFAAFALALGTGQTFAGLLSTLPQFLGSLFQLITPSAVRRLGSYRRWVVLAVSLQAASLLLLPLAALATGGTAGLVVFAAVTVYWAAGLSSAPAWNTWIEEVIPKRLRTNYFACRVRISQFCTMLGLILGGIALQLGRAATWQLTAFAAIFLAASACRFVSAAFLARQSEPSGGNVPLRRVTFRQFFADRRGSGGRLVLYLLAVQVAVQISGPYFAPFMLKDLLAGDPLKYMNYLVLVAICFLAKVIALPLWGRVAHVAGPRRLLWIGGIGIVPVAGLWLFADALEGYKFALWLPLGSEGIQWHLTGELVYLACVQALSGVMWAAYELAMALMFFEAIPRSHRTSMLAIYNFGNASALVAGSLIGAAVLLLLAESHFAYLCLFALSTIARLVTLLFLRSAPSRPLEDRSVPGPEAQLRRPVSTGGQV
jgi:MFS family permease